MYCDFFGLRERPFDDRSDTRFLYLTTAWEEILASLEYHIRFGHGLSVVLGDAGIGKTTMLRALLARLHATDHMVVVTARAGETKSLIRETAKGFGLTLAASDRGANTSARLERILRRTMEADHRSILIVDQAEHLDESNVDELGTMLDLESESTRLLYVVIFAQPRFMQMLDRSECGRIRQQACGAHILAALQAVQVGPYIQHRLSSAGIADPDVFDPRAYELIHAASGGNQRLVNRICDEAFVAAYGSRENPIPLDIVAEIVSQHAGTDALAAGSIVEDRQDYAESIKANESIPVELEASERKVNVPPSHVVDSIRPSTLPPATLVPSPIAGIERAGGGVDPAVDDALANVKAQLRRQEMVASSIESLLSDGDTLATRLETAIRQAHRVAATHDTAMGQYTCVEQHLGSLTVSAERLVASLPGSVDQATKTLSSIEHDQARLTDELNERITALEQRSDGVHAVCREIDQRLGSLDRMETASRHAEAIEARLSAYAEQLAEKAEHAQERIALLMTGMDAGENVHVKLETMVRKVSEFVEETDRGIDRRQRSLQETIDRADNLAASGVEERLTVFRDRLNAEFDSVEHAHRPKIDNALTRVQDQLRALESKADALEDRAEESAAGVRKKFQQTIREFGQAQSHAIDEIIQAKRAQLDELAEEVEARTQSFDSAVKSRCAELQDGLESLDTRHRGFLEDVSAKSESWLRTKRAQLDELAEQVESSTRSFDSAVASRCTELQNGLESLDTRHREFLEDVSAKSETWLQAKRAQLDGLAEESEARTQSFDSAVASRRAELQDGIESLETRHREFLENASAKSEMWLQRNLKAFEQHSAREQVLARRVEAFGDRFLPLEKQAGTIDALMTNVSDRLDETRGNIQLATKEIAGVEADVVVLAERASSTHVELQSHVQNGKQLLAEVCQTSGRLDEIQKTTSQTLQDIGGACERLQVLRDAGKHCEGIAVQLAAARDETDRAIEQLAQQSGEAGEVINAIQRSAQEARDEAGKLSSHTAAAVSTLNRLSDANATGNALVDRVHDCATAIDERIETVTVDANQAVATARRAVESMRSAPATIQDLERGKTQAKEAADALRDVVHEAEMHREKAQASCVGLRETVGELTTLDEAANDRIGQFRDGLTELTEKLGDIDSARTQATRTIERADGLRSVVVDAERAEAALANYQAGTVAAQAAAESTMKLLDERSARARDILTNEQRRLESMEATAKALERTDENARTTLANVNSALSHLDEIQTAHDRAADAIDRAEHLGDLVVEARRSESALTQHRAAADAARVIAEETLIAIRAGCCDAEEKIKRAVSCKADLDAIATDADERIQTVKHETEIANQAIETLRTAADGITDRIEQFDQRTGDTEERLETANRLVEDAWKLSTSMEKRAKDLEQGGQLAAGILRKLDAAAPPAGALCEQLARQVASADTQSTTIAAACEQAREVVTRLASVRQTLEEATRAGNVVQGVVDSANAMHEQLASITDEARQHLSELTARRATGKDMLTTQQRLNGEARDLIDKLGQALLDAEDIAEKLGGTVADCSALNDGLADRSESMTRGIDKGEQLVAAMIEREDAVAAGKALLRSFSDKAKAVFERFDVVESRAKQVEQVVADAIAKPNEVISTARSQAAHLERVCGAVRKVFAGLSETTIKANAQTRRFDDESKSALSRLERLKAETDRSSNTLRTWVEEAVRVQSRLAESISAAPPISATHPPDAIAGLAGVLETTGQTVKTADAPRDTVMPPRRNMATLATGEDPEIAAPRTRTDEISRLIGDVKQGESSKV